MGKVLSGSRCGDPGIGFAHRVAEAPDRAGVFHAGRRLDAGGDVNGPGPQLQDSGNDVCGMQPTRQNEPMRVRKTAGTSDQSKTFPPPPKPSTWASRRRPCASW